MVERLAFTHICKETFGIATKPNTSALWRCNLPNAALPITHSLSFMTSAADLEAGPLYKKTH